MVFLLYGHYGHYGLTTWHGNNNHKSLACEQALNRVSKGSHLRIPLALTSPFPWGSHVTSRDSPKWRACWQATKIRPYVEWKITITSKRYCGCLQEVGMLWVWGHFEIWSLGLVFAYIRKRKVKCFHHNLPFKCSFGSSHNPKGTSDEALRTSAWEAILEALPGEVVGVLCHLSEF